MCVNSQLYRATQECLFRDCVIRILVDESGYSFLESHPGGPFPEAGRGQHGIKCSHVPNAILNYQCRDRFTDWHKSFMSNFDFTRPRKLVIRIQSPEYENPEGLVHIREHMMDLCNVLRKCPKINAIEVEPQRQGYRHIEQQYYKAGEKDIHGSYFSWEYEDYILPASQPWSEHEAWRDFYGRMFKKDAVWRGGLSHLLLRDRSDLQLVLQPLQIVENVAKATIILPSTTKDITLLQERIRRLCLDMSGPETDSSSVKMSELLAFHQRITNKCHTALKDPDTRTRIRRVKRMKAKDMWYRWHCEKCEKGWTEQGEPGYDSDDEPEW